MKEKKKLVDYYCSDCLSENGILTSLYMNKDGKTICPKHGEVGRTSLFDRGVRGTKKARVNLKTFFSWLLFGVR